MQNAELIAGLQKVQEGISEVVSALQSGSELPINPPAEATAKKTIGKAAGKTPAKVEENKATANTADTIPGHVSKEDLDAMSYNNLKTLAKDLNIPAVGNRDQIIAKILSTEVNVSKEDDTEAPVKKVAGKATIPAKNTTPAKGNKITAISSKQKVVEPEPVVEVEETVDDSEVRDQVNEAIEGMSTEDIATFLADNGLPAKGKRPALIDRIVQAVLDGTISLSDDDDDEEGAEVGDKTEEEAEEAGEGDEEDTINDLSNPDMTEERKDAIEDMDKEIRRQVKKKELKRKDMVEFLQQFYATDEDMSEYDDGELLDTYIDAVCRLIDDSGETIEEGSYMLNGEAACCGRHLQYDEKHAKFVCEQCGETYEAEEE